VQTVIREDNNGRFYYDLERSGDVPLEPVGPSPETSSVKGAEDAGSSASPHGTKALG
jgi:hypothetical protein